MSDQHTETSILVLNGIEYTVIYFTEYFSVLATYDDTKIKISYHFNNPPTDLLLITLSGISITITPNDVIINDVIRFSEDKNMNKYVEIKFSNVFSDMLEWLKLKKIKIN
jgi:hypothetical protein